MMRYKIDVTAELTKRGWGNKRCRDEKVISQSTWTRLKRGEPVTTDTLNVVCLILRIQPGDLFEIVPSDDEKLRFF